MTSAIILCAGSGERAGFGYNKLLKDSGGITPFERVLTTFSETDKIDEIIVVCSAKDMDIFKQKCLYRSINARFTLGGATRTESVKNGLKDVKGDVVLIHDGARPFVTKRIIENCIETAKKYGSAITVVKPVDTICKTAEDEEGEYILSSTRKNVYAVQTPQGFMTSQIKKAYSMITESDEFTDDSGVYSKYIGKCRVIEGDIKNKKLTYAEDFSVGDGITCGVGFDLHLLTPNRKLILGGVEIPHDKGLLGHSDADVLTHAIMDAMLSSASLGDIGRHFPDTDPKYRGISSMLLLENVVNLLKKQGYKLINVTAVIQAQKPKLAKYVDKIRGNLAKALMLDVEKVGITCTTLEGIGTVGREEGIAVSAYCLTRKEDHGEE